MLPTCPACGQSVLDDDAAECPFCGASMSGKPVKTAAPAAPAAAEQADPAAAAPAAEPKKRKPKPRPGGSGDGDNPFETAPGQTRTAIQAARKPVKGRLLKVVCPMCDTPGFVPKKAAGQDVRCANKQCLVPVFKAPAPKKTAVAEPEPETGNSSTIAIVAGIVGILVVGGVLYVMFGRDSGEKNNNKIVDKGQPDNSKSIVAEILNANKKGTDPTPKSNTPASLFAIREQTLEKLDDAADARNDDKPFCRLMTTEALIAADQFERAVKEAKLIGSPGDSKYYYRVFPFTSLAWAHLAAGDQTQAAAAIDSASKSMGRLPQFGRAEFDAITAMAAVMVASGQADAAEKLVNDLVSRRPFDDRLNHRAAMASYLVSTTFAFEESGADVPGGTAVTDWTNPPWTATALVLCAHGRTSEAVEWAGRASSRLVTADTLAGIAAYSAEARVQSALEQVVGAAANHGPAVIARVHAAAAYGAMISGEQSVAESQLKSAQAAFAGVPQPTPVEIRSLRELYEYEPADSEPAALAALSAAEVARAQADTGSADAAAQTLLTAIRHAHSFCPAPRYIQQRAKAADANADSLRAQLESALNMSSGQAQQALYKLSAKLSKALPAAAAERTELQAGFLRRLAESKLGDSVWLLVNPATLKQSILGAEGLEDTPLPWQVANAFWRAGRGDDAKRIAQQLGDCPFPVAAAEQLAHQSAGAPATRVAGMLSPSGDSNSERVFSVLMFARKYTEADLVEAVSFARGLRNPQWRREVLRLVGTRVARSGKAREVVQIVDGLELESPDRTAIYRGVVSGIRLDPEFAPPAQAE